MSSDCRTMRLWASKSLNQSERRSPHCRLCLPPACSCQIIRGSWYSTGQSGKSRLTFTSWKRDLSSMLMFVHVPWGCWWGARIFKNHRRVHTLAPCNHDKACVIQARAWFFKSTKQDLLVRECLPKQAHPSECSQLQFKNSFHTIRFGKRATLACGVFWNMAK